jgi:hypothetical protein
MPISWHLEDYYGYFLLWLTPLLDDGLQGRASDETRIYDFGQVARFGLEAESIARTRQSGAVTRAGNAKGLEFRSWAARDLSAPTRFWPPASGRNHRVVSTRALDSRGAPAADTTGMHRKRRTKPKSA